MKCPNCGYNGFGSASEPYFNCPRCKTEFSNPGYDPNTGIKVFLGLFVVAANLLFSKEYPLWFRIQIVVICVMFCFILHPVYVGITTTLLLMALLYFNKRGTFKALPIITSFILGLLGGFLGYLNGLTSGYSGMIWHAFIGFLLFFSLNYYVLVYKQNHSNF